MLNAANEAAVNLFLEKRIGFLDIARLIDGALQAHRIETTPEAGALLAADLWARDHVAGAAAKL